MFEVINFVKKIEGFEKKLEGGNSVKFCNPWKNKVDKDYFLESLKIFYCKMSINISSLSQLTTTCLYPNHNNSFPISRTLHRFPFTVQFTDEKGAEVKRRVDSESLNNH